MKKSLLLQNNYRRRIDWQTFHTDQPEDKNRTNSEKLHDKISLPRDASTSSISGTEGVGSTKEQLQGSGVQLKFTRPLKRKPQSDNQHSQRSQQQTNELRDDQLILFVPFV